MLKRDELHNPASCINRAQDGEMVFVLLARDACAAACIRTWAEMRVLSGRNTFQDDQIQEALRCAAVMDQQRIIHAAHSEKPI